MNQATPLLPLKKVIDGGSATNDDKAIGVFPLSLNGQALEVTVYVVFSAASAAGTVLLESAHDYNYTGTWFTEGTATWEANTSVKALHLTAANQALRVRISSAVTSGTCDVYIMAYGLS